MITEAIILAGGKGTRLGPDAPPKALVEINGKPLICRQIKWLFDNGIEKVILALGHNAMKVIWAVNSSQLFRDQYPHKDKKGDIERQYTKKIVYSTEQEPRGTAGAIKLALEHITTERFLICNVDDLTDIDVQEMSRAGENVIALARTFSPFGVVTLEEGTKRIVSFGEKTMLHDIWVSAGVAIVSRKDIELLLPDKGSLEKEVYPFLRAVGFNHPFRWTTINDPKQLKDANEFFRQLEGANGASQN